MRVYFWGYSGKESKKGKSITVVEPNEVFFLKSSRVTAISCGALHSAFIVDEKDLYCFGHGESGQLGDGRTENLDVPKKIVIADGKSKLKAVSCGSRHTIVVTEAGKCYGFGNNFDAQLSFDYSCITYKSPSLVPKLLETVDEEIVSVACGGRHSVLLTRQGNVLTFGSNSCGQLGHDEKTEDAIPNLIHFPQEVRVSKVVAGENCTALITEHGDLYMFGYGPACGSLENLFEPKKISFETAEVVKDVQCGNNHSVILTIIPENGVVYTIGTSSHGELGDGEKSIKPRGPILVKELLNEKIVQIGVGERFSIALSEFSNLLFWGQNTDSVFGKGASEDQIFDVPTLVAHLNDLGINGIQCGGWHVLAVAEDGETKQKGKIEVVQTLFEDNDEKLMAAIKKKESPKKKGFFSQSPKKAEVFK